MTARTHERRPATGRRGPLRGALLGVLLGALLAYAAAARAQGAPDAPSAVGGRVAEVVVRSARLAPNKIGVGPERRATVYLPAGYDGGAGRYPVIYYLHGVFDDHRTLYARDGARAVFDRAVREGVVPGVIVVAADCSTPLGGSFYASSPVTGDWEGFLAEELVAYVDAHYRTLAAPDARGLLGDRMGGYGALRLAMRRPGVFGAVYALHPVGTGAGLVPMHARPDWARLAAARSPDDLRGDPMTRVFAAIYQAFLPDTARAPLFFAPPARLVAGRVEADRARTERLLDRFLLDRQVGRYAHRLKALRGLKLDWGRNDPLQDHVVANEGFARVLDEYGVPYEAEAYRGGWGDRHWGADGRVYTDALPFFRTHLRFAPPGGAAGGAAGAP